MSDQRSARELTHALGKLDKRFREKQLEGSLEGEMLDKARGKRDELVQAIRKQALEERSSRGDKTIRGVTDRINTDEIVARIPEGTDRITTKPGYMKVQDAAEVAQKNARKMQLRKLAKSAGKVASKGLKSIPIIGGLISALSSGDASAAIPVLGDIEGTGPSAGSPGAVIEDPNSTPEARRKAIEMLRKKMRSQ